MNKDKSTDSYADDYDIVSAHYERVAIDTTPDSATRAILRSAKAAASGRENILSGFGWPRTIALVATFCFSLAVVLQIFDYDTSGASNGNIDVPQTGVEASNAFGAAANQTLEQIRAAEHAAPEQTRQQTRQSDSTRQQSPVTAAETSVNSLLPDTGKCSAEQKSTTASWWQCIQTLESQGLTNIVTTELENFYREYPAFVIPE